MAIGFNQIPNNVLVPFIGVEIDSSRAGGGEQAFRSLLIGQKLAAGTASAAEAVQVITPEDGVRLFGAASMLSVMATAFLRANPLGELWAVPLDDAGGATKPARTITIGAAATAAGTIAVYVNGRRTTAGVSAGDAVAVIAAAIAASINADSGSAATAGSAAGVVTVTGKHGGAAADLDVRVGYHSTDQLPAGVTAVVAAKVAGATDPDIADAIAALGDEKFNIIASAYSEAASISALEQELDSRWGPTRQIAGQAITAYKGVGGTVAQGTTYGNLRNSKHSSVMDAGHSPSATYEWCAAVAGAVSLAASIDPARPFQTLPLPGILAPVLKERRTFAERNTLLSDGIATHSVDRDGTVRIDRLVTTYQEFRGVRDDSYRDANSLFTLDYIRTDFRARLLLKYPRHKLADDGSRIGPGQPVITPAVGKGEAVAAFREWETAGLVEGFDQFKSDLICERNAQDPNRLDWLMSPDLVNQFRVAGVKIQFLL